MNNRRNYYRILHVQPEAPTPVIRSSYRTLMQRMKVHPDLGGDGGEASLLNEAWSVLRDPKRRARYDREIGLARGRPASDDRPASTQGGPEDPANDAYQPTQAPSGSCGFCEAPIRFNGLVSQEDDCHHCASPLYPAGKEQLETESQRAIQRLDRRIPLVFCTEGDATMEYPGETGDVSLHGMQIVTSRPPRVGQVIKIASSICQATARVVNCRTAAADDQCWQIGVEFLTLRFERASGSFVSARA